MSVSMSFLFRLCSCLCLCNLTCRTVSEHMGWVRNVVLMNVYLGLEKPQGVRISGEGPHGHVREMRGVSLRATRERGGWILSQQGGFQVSGKGSKGIKGIIMYIAYIVRVYNGMIAVMNDTSCIYIHDNNNRNECC
jgi:hypothetical protein